MEKVFDRRHPRLRRLAHGSLGPGDFLLFDISRLFDSSVGREAFLLQIPRPLLPLHPQRVDRPTFLAAAGRSSAGRKFQTGPIDRQTSSIRITRWPLSFRFNM